MTHKTQPQGLKSNGKPKSLQVTDDGYLKIDMQDTTVVAEFTPGSNVTLLDTAGTNEASIDSSGALKVVEKTPLTSIAVSSITAGETHLGEIGGSTDQISPTVTVDTAAYSAGDVIGGKLTLTNAMRISGGTGLLQSLLLIDASGTQKPALEILIFNSDPTASTLTDQATISVHADDVSKVIRKIDISASDWTLIGSKYYADLSPGSRVLKASGSRNLYAAIVAVGTPTFAAATNLSIRFGILRD